MDHKTKCGSLRKKVLDTQSHSPKTNITPRLKNYIETMCQHVIYKQSIQGWEQVGRCLVAATEIKERDIILQEEPFETVPGEIQSACFHCGTICGNCIYQECKDCHSLFCSKECFDQSEARHKVSILYTY